MCGLSSINERAPSYERINAAELGSRRPLFSSIRIITPSNVTTCRNSGSQSDELRTDLFRWCLNIAKTKTVNSASRDVVAIFKAGAENL